MEPISTAPAAYATTRSVAVELSREETAALLTECGRTYRTGINELLLSGVYLGVRQWSGQTRLRLTLEAHGREQLFDELDTTETVGCFTTTYPVVLGSEDGQMGAVIKAVKEQYRAVPHHGIGYGLLRHLAGDELLMAAEQASPPALLFNYLGQFDQTMAANSWFAIAPELTGEAIDPRRMRTHALSLNGLVAGGVLRFQLDYSEAQYAEATVAELAGHIEQGLREVIAHCLEVGEGDYTPSDFPLVAVGQEVLDEWQREYEIEDLYPLTAMQRGMLFHSLLEREAYVTQLYPTLEGDLRAELLRQAWEKVMEQQAIFRTIFVGEGELQQQLVMKRARLPWVEEDWRNLTEGEQEARFEEYRRADKAKGFEETQAPLMRISLFRLGDRRYRLLWSHHHSLLDGWSVPLVYGEVMEVYAGLVQGRPAVRAAGPGYASYVEWLLAQDEEEARRYWRSYLTGVDAVTRLPYDKLVGEERPRHDSQVVSLSASDTAELKALAKRYQTTVNTLVQLAWAILLQRYSGDREVMFGAVISGRSAEVEGIETMVGLFINTIPVVVRFDEEGTIAGVINRLHKEFQRSQTYGHLSLTEIQKQSGLSRGRGLFDSILVFENYPLDSAMGERTRGASVRIDEVGTDIEDTYPIALGVFQGERLEVTCNYFGNRFSASTIRRLLGQFIEVLRQIGSRERAAEIRLLSEEEERQVIEWGAGAEVETSPLCVHELIERQADKTPHAVAVVCSQQRLSYLQLNQKADRLARYLLEAGVGIGSRVGIHLRRSAEMMIAVLGVMKAGAAYVPLEAGLPSQRVEYMMRDAGVECVLVESGLMEGMRLSGVDVVMMDGAATDPAWLEEMAGEATEAVRRVRADDLAYILYTSGLTGKPKGVMVEHQGLSNYLSHAAKSYLKEGIKGSVVSSPLSFDATLTTLMTPLVAGGSVELLEEDEGLIERLADRMFGTEEGLLFKVTPSHLEALEYVDRSRRESDARHVVVVGGEQLRAELVRRWKGEMLREAVFVNEYGPTEAVVGCSVWELRDDEGMRKLEGMVGAPIGRPIANTQMYVMGEGCQLQPIGSVGELYIGGAGVARGYVKDEEKTREMFIEDPYEEGERVYRTGDLVRWREEGELEFVGRRDEQVKVRGYRIELGEIEQELRGVEGVEGAVVVAREVEGGQKQLVGYVVIEEEAKRAESEAEMVGELREGLRRVLPDYMVPTRIVVLEQLPLTPNGKVDRKALPAPEAGEVERVYVAARDETEEALCEVWQEVLKVEQVGIHDNFFSLGGDSIFAIRVVSMLKSLGIGLDIKDIFQHQTVEQLAVAASQGRLNQETFIDPNQIAQMLISERDEFDENVSEIIL